MDRELARCKHSNDIYWNTIFSQTVWWITIHVLQFAITVFILSFRVNIYCFYISGEKRLVFAFTKIRMFCSNTKCNLCTPWKKSYPAYFSRYCGRLVSFKTLSLLCKWTFLSAIVNIHCLQLLVHGQVLHKLSQQKNVIIYFLKERWGTFDNAILLRCEFCCQKAKMKTIWVQKPFSDSNI